ncbi:MAG: hypothetical protein D6766_12305, partial [Verrucomicrobia bacterium]
MERAWLEPCERLATAVESAVATLGVRSGPLALLPARCAAFREACRLAVAGRGSGRLTIAFVGPRNAGKTTLLRSLISDPAVADQLPVGPSRPGSTRRLDWVGPEQPATFDPEHERWVRCPSEALPAVGLACELLDVPGFDDRDAALGQTARRALALAPVKVLVVDAGRLEDAGILDHLEEADGSCLLPVVNQVRSLPEEDVQRFWERLREAAPEAEVLEPVLVADFGLPETEESAVLAAARREIVARVTDFTERWSEGGSVPERMWWRRLTVLRERFQAGVRRLAAEALPATAEALRNLDRALREAPRRRLLAAGTGAGEGAEALLRLRLRALLLARTPHGLVPWRLALGLAHLIWGVLDRSVLMLFGSPRAWWSAAVEAGRTLRAQRRFPGGAGLEAGGENPVMESIRAELEPCLRSVQESLARDLGAAGEGGDRPTPTPRLSVRGLEAFVGRVGEVWEELIERWAPGRAAVWFGGLVGMLLFWSIALGPLISVYQAHFEALRGLVSGEAGAPAAFPRDLGSLLGTAVVLGMIPMALWMVAYVSWLTRRSRLRRLGRVFRDRLEGEVERAIESGLVRIEA